MKTSGLLALIGKLLSLSAPVVLVPEGGFEPDSLLFLLGLAGLALLTLRSERWRHSAARAGHQPLPHRS